MTAYAYLKHMQASKQTYIHTLNSTLYSQLNLTQLNEMICAAQNVLTYKCVVYGQRLSMEEGSSRGLEIQKKNYKK